MWTKPTYCASYVRSLPRLATVIKETLTEVYETKPLLLDGSSGEVTNAGRQDVNTEHKQHEQHRESQTKNKNTTNRPRPRNPPSAKTEQNV